MRSSKVWICVTGTSRKIAILFLLGIFLYGLMSSVLYFRTTKLTVSKTEPKLNQAQSKEHNNDFPKIPFVEQEEKKKIEELPPEYDAEALKEIDHIVKESMSLKSKKKWGEALDLLESGIKKYPRSDQLTTHKGGWYFDQGNWTMAAYWYEQAHNLNPKEPTYVLNIALCLVNLKRDAEAGKWYQIAYEINPSTPQLIALCNNLWKFNNWTNYDKYVGRILSDVRQEIKENRHVSINSYTALHLPFTLKDIQDIAASESRKIADRARREVRRNYYHKRTEDDRYRRIRVGFVSYDFRNHAVGLQIQSMFGFHDKTKFEVFAYNTNDGLHDAYENSPVYNKIKSSVEHMVNLGSPPVGEAADRIYNDSIDILIDLGLFTAYHRMDILSLRPAPIQAAYLGLATTTGAKWIDYLIADKVVIPDRESAKYYTENIVYMPHQYHIFDHKQMYGLQPRADRSQHGFSDEQFLLCNHANNIRLSPDSFPHWVNILNKVPNSTLVLKYYNEDSANNIRIQAKAYGLKLSDDKTKTQLAFMPGAGGAAHISLKAMCDVYLDVRYYNGHSTGGDLLWAGVPMITFPERSMASRAGAAFATAAGAPEMIVHSWPEYESLAMEYASNKAKYKELRHKLESTRMTMPLFDTQRWVKNLESALEKMYDRLINNEEPAPIIVEDVLERQGEEK